VDGCVRNTQGNDMIGKTKEKGILGTLSGG
jgi:hypothetical protein